MAHIPVRESARELRMRGKSIAEIAAELNASKSTVSHWCRNITLTPLQIQKLARMKEAGGVRGRLIAAEKKRNLRKCVTEKEYVRGAADVGSLSKRDVYITGLALYWGEGTKKGNEECGVSNSDPAIILAFIRWIKECYGITSTELILRVSVNADHAQRLESIEHYWSSVTKIPLTQFTKASLIKTTSKKAYRNTHEHFGTLRVKIRRGTNLHRRIMGSIERIQRAFMGRN